jgi:hypothetical protein
MLERDKPTCWHKRLMLNTEHELMLPLATFVGVDDSITIFVLLPRKQMVSGLHATREKL